MARSVRFSFLRGSGSNLEVLFGKVSLTPTNMHMLSSSAVLPAPSTFDLVNGVAIATNVVPTPAPVGGKIAWAYVVKVTDTHAKSFEYMVGVPDGTAEINFNVLPRYFETKPEAWGVGPAGPAGISATVAVGTVTSGTTPNVVNSGTNTNAVLNFTLAKGDKGDTGAGVPAGGSALQVIRKNAGNTSTEWATLVKASVGLSNVDNTSDANKPVSNATQSALTRVLDEEDDRVSDLVMSENSQTSASLRSKYVSKNEAFVDVNDFGANIGTGSSSSAAFQAAIDYAATHNIGLVISPGESYAWGEQIKLRSDVTLDFRGANIYPYGANGSGMTTTSLGARGYGSGGKNITIRNGTIHGDFANNVVLGNSFHHAQNLRIEDMDFPQAIINSHNIDLMGCKDVFIDRCTFSGAKIVPGRKYLEAIQVDHSTRGGAGSALVEDLDSYDGLPCVNINVTDCESRPITVDGETYLSPRLVGSHSRVSNIRHKGITLRDVKITDSAETTADENYRGWIHFIHAEDILIDGLTCINNLGNDSVLVGFGAVSTTYPLSSVGTPAPVLTSEAGPVACRDISVKNVRVFGNASNTTTSLFLAAGISGAPVENIDISVVADGFHAGTWGEYDSGATVCDFNRVNNASMEVVGRSVRRLINVTNSTNIQLSHVAGTDVFSSAVRVANTTGFSMVAASLNGVAAALTASNSHRIIINNNLAYSSSVDATPQPAMYSISGCTNINVSNNISGAAIGTLLESMVDFYGTSQKGVANYNTGSGFSQVVKVAPNSTITVVGSISLPA